MSVATGQPHIYAALYHEQAGTWPESVRLIPLQGDPVTIPVSPGEASTLAQEALASLTSYNQQVESGASLVDLAHPSVVNCQYCSYKAFSPAFWQAAEPSWDLLSSVSILGTVTKIQKFGDGTRSIEIDVTRGNLPPGTYRLRRLTTARFSGLEEVLPEMAVRIISARRENRENSTDLLPGVFDTLKTSQPARW